MLLRRAPFFLLHLRSSCVPLFHFLPLSSSSSFLFFFLSPSISLSILYTCTPFSWSTISTLRHSAPCIVVYSVYLRETISLPASVRNTPICQPRTSTFFPRPSTVAFRRVSFQESDTATASSASQ